MSLPTKLFHYSGRMFDTLVPEFFDKFRESWPEEGAMKPCGLWVSVEESEDDHSWYHWCKGEQFRLEALKYKYAVTLAPDIKILHLKSEEDIMKFSLEYCANDPFDFSRKSFFQRDTTYVYMISWNKVKAKYDGIMIAPYQGKCSVAGECAWYYHWDCSNACIWNLDKISFSLHSIIDVDKISFSLNSIIYVESLKDNQETL